MNILNLPGWEVTGHTQTKTDYRIEAVYGRPPPTGTSARQWPVALIRHTDPSPFRRFFLAIPRPSRGAAVYPPPGLSGQPGGGRLCAGMPQTGGGAVTDLYATDDWRAMVSAIRAAPDEDLPRLAAADWLDDRGECERAEFVRTQVAFANEHRVTYQERLRRRIKDMLRGCVSVRSVPWVTHLLDGGIPFGLSIDGWYAAVGPFVPHCRVRRGFADTVTCGGADWVKHGDALLAREPVRRVTLTTWPAMVEHFRPVGGSGYFRLADHPDPVAPPEPLLISNERIGIGFAGDPKNVIVPERILMLAKSQEKAQGAAFAYRWPGVEFVMSGVFRWPGLTA